MNFPPLLLALFLLGCSGEENNTNNKIDKNKTLCDKNNKINMEDWNVKAFLQMMPEKDKQILIKKGLTETSMFKKIIKALIESEKNKEEQNKKAHAAVVKKDLSEKTQDEPKKGNEVGNNDEEQVDAQEHVERIPRWRYKYHYFPNHEYIRYPYGYHRHPSYMERRAKYMKPRFHMNEPFPADWEYEKYSGEIKHRVKRGTNEVLEKTNVTEEKEGDVEKKKSEEKYTSKLEKVEGKGKEDVKKGEGKKEEEKGRKAEEKETKKEEEKGRKEEEKETKKEEEKNKEKEDKGQEGKVEKPSDANANKSTGLAIYQDQRSLNSSQASNSSSSSSTDPGHPHIHQPSQVQRFFENIKNMFSSIF